MLSDAALSIACSNGRSEFVAAFELQRDEIFVHSRVRWVHTHLAVASLDHPGASLIGDQVSLLSCSGQSVEHALELPISVRGCGFFGF